MKLQRKVKIKNGLGLHARPATSIAKLLQKFKASVTFTYRHESVNARSIMSILMLAANKNSQIIITCDGEDAQEAMDSLVEAFEKRFGEDHVSK
ncbi:MAG TPA: HPr family phosphocarrier protein [Rhabdochlamydiaceae bacterium]|nr:HPr family phosphocarrier protein [Rhabdochlamydiaceae bacterium]